MVKAARPAEKRRARYAGIRFARFMEASGCFGLIL
jgi:hypothetical protein